MSNSIKGSWLTSVLAVLAVVTVGFSFNRTEGRDASVAGSRSQARDRMLERLKTKQALRYDKPDEALAFYWAKRSPNGQAMSVSDLEDAAEQAAQLPAVQRAGSSDPHTTSVPLASASSASSVSGTLQAWQ